MLTVQDKTRRTSQKIETKAFRERKCFRIEGGNERVSGVLMKGNRVHFIHRSECEMLLRSVMETMYHAITPHQEG